MYRDYTSTSSRHYGDNATSLNAASHPSDAAPSSQRQSHSCATYSSSAASYLPQPAANPTPAPVVQPDVLPIPQLGCSLEMGVLPLPQS